MRLSQNRSFCRALISSVHSTITQRPCSLRSRNGPLSTGTAAGEGEEGKPRLPIIGGVGRPLLLREDYDLRGRCFAHCPFAPSPSRETGLSLPTRSLPGEEENSIFLCRRYRRLGRQGSAVVEVPGWPNGQTAMSACWLGLTSSKEQRVAVPEPAEQRLQRVSGRPKTAQPRRPDSSSQGRPQ